MVRPRTWSSLALPAAADLLVLERLPATRDSARRLGMVSLGQMLRALAVAGDHPVQGVRVLEVPEKGEHE